MTAKRRAQCSSSSSSSSKADMASLFRLPTVDIADRLNAMLETERRPHYQLHDYLRQRRHRHQPSRSQCSQSQCSSLHSSPTSTTRSSRPSPASSSQPQQQHTIPQQHQAVDPSSRSKIVKWLYDCADYLSLRRECVAVATNYVDRFMSTNNSPRSSATNAKKDTTIYQLVAISSLFLAAKQSDKMLSRNSNSSSSNSATLTLLDASVLVKVSHGSYSAKEILDMEQEILTALDWHLCPPTSLGFAHELIALLVKVVGLKRSRRSDPPENDKKSGKGNHHHNQRINSISSVVDFTRLQLELAVSDYSSSILVRAPSTIALASVLNSMELLDFSDVEKRSFARLIFDCTHNKLDVESREVNKARAQLQVVFDNHCQSNDVMSCAAANKKDSKSTCGSTLSSRSPVSVDNNDIESSLSHRHRESYQSSGTKSSSSRRKNQNQSRVNGNGSRSRNRQPPQPSPHSVNTASFQRLQLEP